jgi:hypothetical protein
VSSLVSRRLLQRTFAGVVLALTLAIVLGGACSLPPVESPLTSGATCDAPQPRDCSFYTQCLEPHVPCGPSGYALGFGDKYCNAFKQADLSPRGEAWVDSTMLCLEKQLVPYATSPGPAATCDQITEAAFASHAGCYTALPASICFLPPPDVLAVLRTIGADEIFTARTRTQVQSVAGTCAIQVGEKLTHAAFDPRVATAELAQQIALWQELAIRYGPLP